MPGYQGPRRLAARPRGDAGAVSGLAVVGHVEWVDFLVSARLPRPGEISPRPLRPRGAGRRRGDGAPTRCARSPARARSYCAVGDDQRGRPDRRRAARRRPRRPRRGARRRPQRRVVTYLTDDGERTITVLGERLVPHGDDPLPWDALARFDGVYLTAGDAAAARAARRRACSSRPRGRATRSRGRRRGRRPRRQRAAIPAERSTTSCAPRAPRSSCRPRAPRGGSLDGGRRRRPAAGRPRRCPARRSTPTAAATRSPPP